MHEISGLLKRSVLLFVAGLFGMSAALADDSRYTILMTKNAVPKKFAATVEAAGGRIVSSLDKVGIVIAVSSDESFADLVASDNRVQSVGLTGYNSLPETVEAAIPDGAEGHIAPDQYFSDGLVWGVQRVNAPAAWDAGVMGSHDTVVAVIDTGVAWTHPDLAQNVVYVACVASVPGCNPYPSLSDHGTHVAGTVAAALGGGGVVGVAPNIGIAGYNVFEDIPGCGTCAYTDARWIAMLDAAENGFEVVTMSLGGYGGYGGGRSDGLATYVAAEQRIAQYLEQQGTVVVASAGNGGADLNGWLIHLPGDVPSIINVGATGIQPEARYPYPGAFDIRAFYGNYGAAVTVSGPGGDCGQIGTCNADRPANWFEYLILSTIVRSDPTCAATYDCAVGYGWKAGTSMATPHVAAVAGLIMDENPGISPKKVRSIIKRTAQKIGSRQEFGHGMVDAAAATQ